MLPSPRAGYLRLESSIKSILSAPGSRSFGLLVLTCLLLFLLPFAIHILVDVHWRGEEVLSIILQALRQGEFSL